MARAGAEAAVCVKALIARLRRRGRTRNGMGCPYGTHSWQYSRSAETKTCTVCGGVYRLIPEEVAEHRLEVQ